MLHRMHLLNVQQRAESNAASSELLEVTAAACLVSSQGLTRFLVYLRCSRRAHRCLCAACVFLAPRLGLGGQVDRISKATARRGLRRALLEKESSAVKTQYGGPPPGEHGPWRWDQVEPGSPLDKVERFALCFTYGLCISRLCLCGGIYRRRLLFK